MGAQRGFLIRATRYLLSQGDTVHLRLIVAQLVVGSLPFHVFPRLRSALYRWAGFREIGPHVQILGRLAVRGRGDLYSRLMVGEGACINHSCDFDLNAVVHIGRRAGIGNHVLISTSTHAIGPSHARCGALECRPVSIGDGAWIGARVTILPGITIGHGAVVTAGSVVASDVPANAKVTGNPARVVGWLDKANQASENVPCAAS